MSVRFRSGALAALLFAALGQGADAQLSLFRSEVQAEAHCPNDSVAWLDFKKRIYYLQGQRLYATGRNGTFVCRDEARRNGYRRSVFGRR